MKRSTVLLAVLAIVALGLSVMPAGAGHCVTSSGPDPFGTYECLDSVNINQLHCPGGTAVGPLAKLYTSPTGGSGVEGCNDNGPVPPYGRAVIFRDTTGNVIIAADGEKKQPGSSGWTRVDIRPGASNCRIQVRRGTSGSYYVTGGGTTGPDINQCVG